MDYEIIKSKRGKNLLIFENFLYNEHSVYLKYKRFRCQKRSCAGAVYLYEDKTLVITKEHNHEPDRVKIEILRTRSNLKVSAAVTTEKSSTIISRITKSLNPEEIIALPQYASMRKLISKERNMINMQNTRKSDDIPPELHRDARGYDFFRYDSGVENEERFIIFSSEFKRLYIEKCKICIIDGTFKTSPPGFFQILVIHGYFFGRSFPLIYILMSSKQTNAYVKAFKKVNEIFNINVNYIITDFETALINACKSQFANYSHFGCLFHFSQSIWRRLQETGLSKKYKSDNKFNSAVRYVLSLAFVPPNKVVEYFLKVKYFICKNNITDMEDFLKYIESVYIGKFDEMSNKFIASVFDIELWNVFLRVKNGIPRTSNNAEAWHKNWNKRNEIPHPNIARLIYNFKEIEELDHCILLRAQAGKFEPSTKNLKKEIFLQNIINSYELFDEFAFLDIISNFFKWDFES